MRHQHARHIAEHQAQRNRPHGSEDEGQYDRHRRRQHAIDDVHAGYGAAIEMPDQAIFVEAGEAHRHQQQADHQREPGQFRIGIVAGRRDPVMVERMHPEQGEEADHDRDDDPAHDLHGPQDAEEFLLVAARVGEHHGLDAEVREHGHEHHDDHHRRDEAISGRVEQACQDDARDQPDEDLAAEADGQPADIAQDLAAQRSPAQHRGRFLHETAHTAMETAQAEVGQGEVVLVASR